MSSTTKMACNILQVKRSIVRSDDISGQQYHTYAPYSTAFNNNDEIRITIQSQDLYVLPSDSYLYLEFAVARRDGAAIVADTVHFTNTFITHMFSEMRYELNGFEIDRCKMPGITCLMKMLKACKESSSECLQLLNLCDDFNKIVLNSKHELIVVRNRTNLNMYLGDDAMNLEFTVNKIVWKIPHVSLNDEAKLSMLQTVARNEDLLIPYRSWDLYELPALPTTTRHTWSVKTTNKVNKPRYVIVGLQTNRNNVAAADSSAFDHCNVTNMKLYLNNDRFPYDDYHLNFAQRKYHEMFLSLTKIQKSYYNDTGGTTPLGDWPTYANFLGRPLFVFDCTRTDESLKPGMVDVRIEIEASVNFPANTTAYCLIIHDNLVRYSPFTSVVQRDI